MNYEELVELLKKERESASLSKVKDSLYEEMEELLKEKEEKSRGGGILLVREYENAKRLVEKIKEERLKKIFYFSLRGISPANAVESELIIYEEFSSILKKFDRGEFKRKTEKEVDEKEEEESNRMEEIEKREEKSEGAGENEKEEDKEEVEIKEEEGKKRIKIVRFVEAYKGIDGNVYGPYSPGEIIEIDEGEADWLIENGYAENE